MTTLFFARHGETAANAKRIFQGQGGSGLSPRGRHEAERLAARMREAELDAIVASDLERAVETANIVGAATGLVPALDRDLREVDVGTWGEKSYDEVARLFPDEWAAWLAGKDVVRGGGETYAMLAERVTRAVARIAASHEGKRVLVVSHGGAIRSYVAKILGVLGKDGWRVLSGAGNASLTIVEHAGERVVLHRWNDTAHLEGIAVEESD
ncbi:MAG: histidine phosphatase family protein [Polyangiaceae bacterium]|nr:histidine phosphatase family protein [Polyangiaceae bacterium]